MSSPEETTSTEAFEALVVSWNGAPASDRFDVLDTEAVDSLFSEWVVRNDNDSLVRQRAIRRLGAVDLLEELALHDEDPGVRMTAVTRLNQDQMIRVAEKSADSRVANAAMWGIVITRSAELVFGRLAEYAVEDSVRVNALKRVSDRDLLRRVATEDASPAVRLAAVAEIWDPTFSASIATHDADPDVRRLALSNVSDRGVITSRATSDEAASVRGAATNMLRAWEPEEAETLYAIAMRDDDGYVRATAVRSVVDFGTDSVCVRLAQHSEDSYVRGQAVRNLTRLHVDLVAKVAQDDPDSSVRVAALERLTRIDSDAAEELRARTTRPTLLPVVEAMGTLLRKSETSPSLDI